MSLGDTVSSVLEGILTFIEGLFFNPFSLTLLIVGVILLALAIVPFTRRWLQWILGFVIVKAALWVFIGILLLGVVFSAAYDAYKVGSEYTTYGCTPSPVDQFPPSNEHDAVFMLCASNVDQVNRITDNGSYDGVQLLAPSGETMSAVLPADMCIIYTQDRSSFGNSRDLTIIDESNTNEIKARTTGVVSFSGEGISAYGSKC